MVEVEIEVGIKVEVDFEAEVEVRAGWENHGEPGNQVPTKS